MIPKPATTKPAVTVPPTSTTEKSSSAAQAQQDAHLNSIRAERNRDTFEKVLKKSNLTIGATTQQPSVYQRALVNQRGLSDARIKLGTLQSQVPGNARLPPSPALQAKIDAAAADVKRWRTEEKALAKEDGLAVSQARFTFFKQRLGELEAKEGKAKTAELARETYYNGATWNAVSGTRASEADINKAGLPVDQNGQLGPGEMATLDGTPVDIGHVCCGIDWMVNGRATSGLHPHVSPSVATMGGDLADATLNSPTGSGAAAKASAAVEKQGDGDWNGDLDGTNIGNRCLKNPGQSLSQVVSNYYDKGDYRHRLDEWATYSPYVKRDANGPSRDASGNYVYDRAAIKGDIGGFLMAWRLDKGQFGALNEDGAIQAWITKMNGLQGLSVQ